MEKLIYRIDDNISFRKCSLSETDGTDFGDCTNFQEIEKNWITYYTCNQYGIHLQCTKHPEIELDLKLSDNEEWVLICPKCKNEIVIKSQKDIINKCLKMLNIEKFKGAKLIRLDDWYVPEVKIKEKRLSDYFLTTDVKTDKDGDTIVIIYVGHKGSSEKTQFFIKPEKGQLSSDHKDLDPAQILSKIEVTLKNRILTQIYEDENLV